MAKPNSFFWVEPDFGPKIRVESGLDGPQGRKPGSIGAGRPQIEFKFWVQPYIVINKPEWIWFEPDFGSGWALRVQIWVELGRVGPQGPNSGWVGSGWSGSFGRTNQDFAKKSPLLVIFQKKIIMFSTESTYVLKYITCQ